MVATPQSQILSSSAAHTRLVIRRAAASVCAAIAAFYLVMLWLVHRAETQPGFTGQDTFGAYLFLTVPYVTGAVLLVLRSDERILWGAGALIQVAVLALFVSFGVGLFGPGVFEYDALSHLPMELLAALVTGAQVVLLGLLLYLAATPATQRRA